MGQKKFFIENHYKSELNSKLIFLIETKCDQEIKYIGEQKLTFMSQMTYGNNLKYI